MNLLGCLPADLGDGVRPEEARRVLSHLIAHGKPNLEGLIQVRREVLRRTDWSWERPEIVEQVEDPGDKSVRFLFKASDGAIFEAVRIPLHKPGHFSVCLSSQVGCAMGCAFCATGRMGLKRNLEAHEIVGSFLQVRDLAPGRVTGAVFMGQGEPFHNYERVIQAAKVLCDPSGARITGKNISISTVGLVPQIHRFASEGLPFRLVVSLTSAIPERRRELLPVAGKWTLQELAEALDAVQATSPHGRTTLAWVLMSGVNTDPQEAEQIQKIFGHLPLRMNLVDVNDPRPDGFRRAEDTERKAFMDALQLLRAPVVRRYSVGRQSHCACGMLSARRAEGAAGGDDAVVDDAAGLR